MLTGEEGFSDSGTDDGAKNNQKAKLMRTQARGQRQFPPIKILPLSHIAYKVNLPRLRILAREGSVFFVAQWLKSRVSYPRDLTEILYQAHRESTSQPGAVKLDLVDPRGWRPTVPAARLAAMRFVEWQRARRGAGR